MKYDVFISYRRDGGDTLSQLIYDRLTHRGYRVFLDIESLNAGKFNEKLLEVIEECKDMVIVLPPNGLDRCHNEGDWLYRELEHGMKHKKNIVPVLMKGFEWPEDIPKEIADIQNYNGIIDNKDYFDAVIDKLTTLLTSKPAVGGNVFRKLGERSTTIKSQVKKRKRIIFGIIFLVLACIAALAGLKYSEKQRRLEEQSNVVIQLTPSEEMNATEFYDAVEIVKERFDILADGQQYSFEEDKDKITVTIPESVFHGIDVQQTLQCYVTRPTEIYLTGYLEGIWNDENGIEESEYFHIDRTSIESVELTDEIPVEVDFSNYELQGIESEEDCQYFAVTVDDETVEAAKEWIKERGKVPGALYQDLQEAGRLNVYFYKLAGVFENDNRLYFVDNYQYSNYLNLILHNYQNETFSNPFYFTIKTPVKWEYDDEEDVTFGENQCNIDEIEENHLARYDFRTYTDEFTDGEYQDVLSAFKARLDALGMPYALGYQEGKIQKISIAMNPDYMNSIIRDHIGKQYGLNVKSRFYELLDNYYIETIEVEEKSDGTYQIILVPTENWKSYEKQNSADQISSEEEIFLCVEDYPEIPLNQSTFSQAFDGEKFVFDSLTSFGLETIGDEEKNILNFFKALQETEIPFSYELEALYTELEQEEIKQILPEPTASEDVKARLEAAVDEAAVADECEITVDKLGQRVTMNIICPENEDYVKYVDTTFKKIYEECNMKSGDVAYTTIYFYKGSKNGQYIYFTISNNVYSHDIQFAAAYYSMESEEIINTFDKLFNEDSFYKQFSVADMYMEDGVISFKYE